MFNNHLSSNAFLKACLAAVFAIGLTACSSSDNGTAGTTDVEPTAQEMCTADGGTWNADTEMCTTAAQLAAMERAEIDTKIKAANTAVTGLTDDASDAAITAAEMAVAAAKKAVTDSSISDSDKGVFNTAISVIEGILRAKKTSIMEAREDADDAAMMAAAKDGKALHKALTANPLGLLAAATADTITDAGALDLPEGTPLSGATPAITIPDMKAGDSAGSLGGWTGTNYAHTDSSSKVANSAVVYKNQGSPTTHTFASQYTTGYTASTRTLALTTDDSTADSKIKGSSFPTTGNMVFKPTAPGGDEVSFSGTYDGASGMYVCDTGGTAGACNASFSANGIILSADGTWTFVHAKDAMVSRPDANYLYFGWWLRKDKDGSPTHASAFTGMEGAVTAGPVGTTIEGSATYAGKAAGKFAMSNPLDGTGDAGHFTADATLTAKFGAIAAPNNGGVSGVINNFMANGESVPWSVELQRAPWGTAQGAFATLDTDDVTTTSDDESKGTVWSIDGNPAPESGRWGGTMYDETTGDADDGSNVPTTVTGTFQSEFGSIGRMVGAFGADKQ